MRTAVRGLLTLVLLVAAGLLSYDMATKPGPPPQFHSAQAWYFK